MARLLVVRHGETLWNAERRMQGHTDTPLSPVGLDQAQALASALADELAPWRAGRTSRPLLFTSDLRRARETADPVARALSLVARPRVDLRERHMGVAQGKTWDELARELPDEVERYRRRGERDAIPGIEPMAAFRERALGAARAIAELAALDGVPAIVVTHGGVLTALLETAHGADKKYLVGNTALFRFEVTAERIAPAPAPDGSTGVATSDELEPVA